MKSRQAGQQENYGFLDRPCTSAWEILIGRELETHQSNVIWSLRSLAFIPSKNSGLLVWKTTMPSHWEWCKIILTKISQVLIARAVLVWSSLWQFSSSFAKKFKIQVIIIVNWLCLAKRTAQINKKNNNNNKNMATWIYNRNFQLTHGLFTKPILCLWNERYD